ncbi:MAG: glycosyl transferase [Candidatus Taylorbacteria bacterium RIFCSPLOWO2_12_FULL_47_20]|uniref:Glycosyl transferase n=2 Tax=Candidatus Tayloriibacteriota TaxID=1817919 RepID=A0A1G2P7Z1_9BACT|nr:MAG: glycosyl transferase [Candidatus Taylorbacteria bacterium RIFCSPLOWO2_02_FULL_46_40]OHA44474.1 MAG: glycosyl transferase [Candidatus Taylorbacteria bacterium RIFCSPLOWO2_12_FULL_47_20]
MATLSIIIPAYNEKETIREIVSAILKADIGALGKEIIAVDDCSTDGTREILKDLEKIGKVKLLRHDKNRGKGTAVRTGLAQATGDYAIIQDADLEYDPSDYKILLAPLLDGHADVVFGSRFTGNSAHRVLFFWHSIGNKFLTTLSNMFTNLNLTDMETCYKAFNRKALREIVPCLRSKRYGIEPEIAARASKGRLRVYEVGISYHGRTYQEGKKINWKDGVAAIWHIIRFGLFD